MTHFDFHLPDVGEGLAEAEIVKWHVAEGDDLSENQALVDLQTDKALVEISSPAAGRVLKLGGSPGGMIRVGSLLVSLALKDESASEGAPALSVPKSSTTLGSEVLESATESAAHSSSSRRVAAAPSTRRLAMQLGVDLTAITGTGPGGRVTRDDVAMASQGLGVPSPQDPVEEAGSGRGAHPTATDRVEPLRGIRKRIAQTMTASWEVPHITEFREVDATQLVGMRRALQSHYPTELSRLTFLPIFIRACGAALRQYPILNATLDMDASTITYKASVNIGIAVAGPSGLVVPVIHDADQKSLAQLAYDVVAASNAVRDKKVLMDQLGGGTFTISNFGSYGAWLGIPLIKPPEAGIAGFGKVHDAVVPLAGVPVVRATLPIAVSADHRLVDGDVLGGFVGCLEELLVNPVLLMEGL